MTGTLVAVVGLVGSADVNGVPTTAYAIDGVLAGNYTPVTPRPGYVLVNKTFFTSPTLDPGVHSLVITNVNGTAPNMFWLDYLLYSPSHAEASTNATGSMAASAVSTTIAAAGMGASSSKSSVAPIAGGVVGGLAAIGIAGTLAWWFLRRKRARAHAGEHGPADGTPPPPRR